MKIIQKLIKLFLLFLVFTSCKNKENPTDSPMTIYMNLSETSTDSMNLSNIAKGIEYIPLQTTDSSLLSYFDDFRVTKDYFFIRHEGCVLKYDKKGKFISRLYEVGRGPDEASARSFTVDEAGALVYVLDNDVKVYDFSGKFIKNIHKPINYDQRTGSIGYFRNNLIVSIVQFPKVKYLFSLFDVSNDSIRVIYKNYHDYDETQINRYPSLIYWIEKSFQVEDSSFLFKEWFCDTIFQVNKNFSIEAKYIIDLSNRKLDWLDWRDHGMFNLAGGPPLGFWVQSFIDTKSFLFIVLKSFKEQRLFAVINKQNDSVKIMANKNYDPRMNTQVYLKNDLDNIIAFPPMSENGDFFYYDNCFYSVIEAKDFANAYQSASVKVKNSTSYLKTMAPVFNSINEFSNPVIMKVYLK